MAKFRYGKFYSAKGLIIFNKVKILLFFLFLSLAAPANNFSNAADLSSNYQLTYEKDLISISATKADLKSILTDIAEKAKISIQYPSSMDNKITLRVEEVPLRKALKRLLKGYNYSIQYAGSGNRASISDIYILDQDKKVPPSNSAQPRTANRIKSYERRIETLKKNLSRVGEDSPSGKRYLSRIKSYEKNIERLKKQLY